MLILLVEDNRLLAANIIEYLELKGIECDYAETIKAARIAVSSTKFDAILLDLNLPDGDGVKLCEEWQQKYLPTPVLMMTARSELQQRLNGFSAGAEDYMIKPIELAELEARIGAVVRRRTPKVLTIGDMKIDFSHSTVIRQERPIPLTNTGWRIIEILAYRYPQMVPKDEIEREIWPDGLPNSDALRSHIYQLRQAIDKPFSTGLIKSVRNLGIGLEVTDNA